MCHYINSLANFSYDVHILLINDVPRRNPSEHWNLGISISTWRGPKIEKTRLIVNLKIKAVIALVVVLKFRRVRVITMTSGKANPIPFLWVCR